MNRRHFFKMLGTAVASVVCAPLAKLLPERRPVEPAFSRGWRIGSTIRIKKPPRFVTQWDLALSPEEFTKRYVQPAFAKVLAEHEKDRALALDDLKHATDNLWRS